MGLIHRYLSGHARLPHRLLLVAIVLVPLILHAASVPDIAMLKRLAASGNAGAQVKLAERYAVGTASLSPSTKQRSFSRKQPSKGILRPNGASGSFTSSDSVFRRMKLPLSRGIGKRPARVTPRRTQILRGCTYMERACQRITWRPRSGTARRQVAETRTRR